MKHESRRDFLKLGSVALVGFAGTTWPTALFAARRAVARSQSILSVGYAGAEPAAEGAIALAPAERLLMGDARFISEGALVTIHSFERRAANLDRLGSVSIDVAYPVVGYAPEEYPTYRAWSYRRDQYAHHASAPSKFRVPIDPVHGLELLFTRSREGSAPVPDTGGRVQPDAIVHLTLGSSSSSAKLQSGVYVVAYHEEGDRVMPRWDALMLVRRGRNLVVPDADFSYMVFTVDFPPAGH